MYSYVERVPKNGDKISENYLFSFGDNFQNWASHGTDLEDLPPPVEWSIDVSDNLATHGDSSARFLSLECNDADKIWLE